MNLHNIVRPLITKVTPDLPITLNIFNGNVVDLNGAVTTSYTTISGIKAQVKLENNQKLQHKNYFNATKIYKKFYLPSASLTGLNRNISTGGDYIILQNLYYKIVEVNENYQVGWIGLVGCESTSEIEGS